MHTINAVTYTSPFLTVDKIKRKIWICRDFFLTLSPNFEIKIKNYSIKSKFLDKRRLNLNYLMNLTQYG